MTLDPITLLSMTVALAAAAGLYLAVEWRNVREPSLLYWCAGFSTIAVGSTLALLRSSGFLFIGIWFANGLLIAAHGLFLMGVARFTQTRLSRAWCLTVPLWIVLLELPAGPMWSAMMLASNSALIALLSLRASCLLRPHGVSLSVGAVQLRFVMLGHGVFYLAKALCAAMPGALIDLASFKGQIIQISLIEGVVAIMLIALSMIGTERHRREKRIARLAARDPLTSLYNRRALEVRAPHLLASASPEAPGALLLIDIDHFKQVNDLHGHNAGDQLLVALSEIIRTHLPQGAVAARLGGDEFVILLKHASIDSIVGLGAALRERFHQVTQQQFPTPDAVTLSVGATFFDQPPASLAALIEQGDAALYESKRDGRDSLRVKDWTVQDALPHLDKVSPMAANQGPLPQ